MCVCVCGGRGAFTDDAGGEGLQARREVQVGGHLRHQRAALGAQRPQHARQQHLQPPRVRPQAGRREARPSVDLRRRPPLEASTHDPCAVRIDASTSQTRRAANSFRKAFWQGGIGIVCSVILLSLPTTGHAFYTGLQVCNLLYRCTSPISPEAALFMALHGRHDAATVAEHQA